MLSTLARPGPRVLLSSIRPHLPIAVRRSFAAKPGPPETLHPIFAEAPAGGPAPSVHTDPYPLPLQHPAHHTYSPNARPPPAAPSPVPERVRADEPLAARRARLVYQSRKRGIVEMELLLSTYVNTHPGIESWDADKLEAYSRLLRMPDWDLYYYIVKREEPPPGSEIACSPLLAELRVHAQNPQKKVLVMPELSRSGAKKEA